MSQLEVDLTNSFCNLIVHTRTGISDQALSADDTGDGRRSDAEDAE